ncbi:hypothetical protein ACO2Q1_02695 [Brevundimonas sp. VNH65]|uniref:hypothetical protein n=1 Tax=Brevundimonas sp. VNH65 TaxID=3400917 RepID=UPI003C0326A6
MQALRDILRRMGFVSALLLTLVFSLPAFESHACTDETPQSVAVVLADDGTGDACSDCGPACANGCCHAPHAATPAALTGEASRPAFALPRPAKHTPGAPLDRPDGPDRPPRT